MKKSFILLTLCFVLFWVGRVYANTPLTSFKLYEVYEDIPIIQEALTQKDFSPEYKVFMASDVPLEQKLAFLSAYFSNLEDEKKQDITGEYYRFVYKKELEEWDDKEISNQDLALFGYISALQNYLEPTLARTSMELARDNNMNSLIVQLLYTLFDIHEKFLTDESDRDLSEVWTQNIQTLSEKTQNNVIRFDLRPQVLQSYFQNMLLPENTIFSMDIDRPLITLYPNEDAIVYVSGGMSNYQVNRLSGESEVEFDGVNVRVRAKGKGLTAYEVVDENGISVNGWVYVKESRTNRYQSADILFSIDKETFDMNGQTQEIDPGRGTKPYLNQDGRTLIPIRAFVEVLGGRVGWNSGEREVLISLDGENLSFTLDQTKGLKNNEVFTMDTSPKIINGRTMVPLRFVSEQLGFSVEWFAENRTIHIKGEKKVLQKSYLEQNGNLLNFGYLAQDEKFTFRLDQTQNGYHLVRIDKNSAEMKTLKEGRVMRIGVWGDDVYYTGEDARVYRMTKDGENETVFLDFPVNELFIIGEEIFFTANAPRGDTQVPSIAGGNTYLYKMDIQDPEKKTMLLVDQDVWDLNTDGKFIYFRFLMQNKQSQGIFRINLAGEDFSKVTDLFTIMYVVDDEEILYLDVNRNLKRYDLRTGNSESIIDKFLYSFYASKNRLYYFSIEDNALFTSDHFGQDERKIRGIPERTILDMNFAEEKLYVFLDFSEAAPQTFMKDLIINENEVGKYPLSKNSVQQSPEAIQRMLEEQLKVPEAGERIAVIKTSFGEMKMKFFPNEAPLAVENFTGLVQKGAYNDLTFHRIMKDFMIQGGDPNGDGTGGTSIWEENFQDEIHEGRIHLRGAVSMANRGPNTNGSQFFIVQKSSIETNIMEQMELLRFKEDIVKKYQERGGAPWLDGRHTVFGQVFEGLNVLDAISEVALSDEQSGKPLIAVKILSISLETME